MLRVVDAGAYGQDRVRRRPRVPSSGRRAARTATSVATAPHLRLARPAVPIAPFRTPVLSSRDDRHPAAACPGFRSLTYGKGVRYSTRPARQPDDPDPTGPGGR